MKFFESGLILINIYLALIESQAKQYEGKTIEHAKKKLYFTHIGHFCSIDTSANCFYLSLQ